MPNDLAMKVLAVGLYAAILVVIGFLASKRVQSTRDYFVSGQEPRVLSRGLLRARDG